jgi:S-adenosylmethionine:tRNA ribosyltransferase-isomerase
MMAASWPRGDRAATRLLVIDPSNAGISDRVIGDLRTLLEAGDVLVVNDAATFPASLQGAGPSGAPLELRLLAENDDHSWRGVLFGAGDWHARTEDRPAPPRVVRGDVLRFPGLRAEIVRVDSESPRLVDVRFDAQGASLWSAIYRAGRPVQYSYLARPLSLWHVQTAYASRPWAAEAPSAGFGLTWSLLLDLRRRGVEIARVTHAAGLSSTGDAALDARLPLAERYEVSSELVRSIEAAKGRRSRVIAIGTTVTRALEGAALNGGGKLTAGPGTTDLLLGPGRRPEVVDGIVTGVHEVGASHFRLLESFADRSLLERASATAEARGYLCHEFGDALAVLPAAR